MKQAGLKTTCGNEGSAGMIPQLWRTPLRIKESQLYKGLPSLEYQCWEEGSPQQLVVKISRDSVLVRRSTARNPGILLKGQSTDSQSKTLALKSREGTEAQKVPRTHGEN